MSDVLGVLVIATNGGRTEFYQDPYTYQPAFTISTPLGVSESHNLGAALRQEYFTSSSPSYVSGMSTDVVDTKEVHVHVKGGGEGAVVFDSATALLQGLFPPNSRNSVELANETVVMAPLGGYQYVPVETIQPASDKSLEPWVDCPNFEKHVAKVYGSSEFKEAASHAKGFFSFVRDYVFGRPTALENAWNIYDYMNTELTYNKTYAYRLPPTLIEQARGWANFHENAVFSDKDAGGIGNIAGRTILSSILTALERIAFNDDPLKFFLIETSYQPLISLFHMTEMIKEDPLLASISNPASALAIELRRGPAPDTRDFLRFQFRNGSSGDFETYHVLGHKADIPLTEFIYRIENYAITSNKQWASVCGASRFADVDFSIESGSTRARTAFSGLFALICIVGLVLFGHFFRARRARKAQGSVRLHGDEVTPMVSEKQRLPL